MVILCNFAAASVFVPSKGKVSYDCSDFAIYKPKTETQVGHVMKESIFVSELETFQQKFPIVNIQDCKIIDSPDPKYRYIGKPKATSSDFFRLLLLDQIQPE